MSLKIKVYKNKSQDESRIFKKIHPALPRTCFRMLISGCSASGKSNLTKNLLMSKQFYGGRFDNVYIMSSTYYINNDYEDVENVRFITTTYNEEFLQKVMDTQNEDDEKKGVLIIDDMASLLPASKNNLLSNLVFKARHLNLSIIFLVQYIYTLPKHLRTNMSNIIIFDSNQNKEIKCLCEEFCGILSERDFMTVYRYAVNEPYSFLHIDHSCKDKYKQFRKGFDTILNINQDL